jgi:DNA invertase Pin-like site-specific DNA recombinase
MASGAQTDRAQLRRVLSQLAAGDVLMVTRLDRLARSTRDLLNTLAAIADPRPASARWATPGPIPRPPMAA